MKEFITNKILMVRPIAFGYNEETGKDNLYQIKENSSADTIEKSAILLKLADYIGNRNK